MTRKVTLLTLLLVVGLSMGAYAQIDNLALDLQLIFDEIGKDMVPNLQTASILNHELGSAELGDFPRMYVSFSAGATVAPGILEFTRDEEKFGDYYKLNYLLEESGANDADVRDITDNYAPYPSLRVGYGVGLFDGYELSLQVGVVPQAVADLSGEDALTASITTVGGRLRKVLVRRDRGVPAISAGIGYVYSNIDIGYDLSAIDPFPLSESDSTSDATTLGLLGEAVFKTTTQSFGFDVRASTRFIRVAYPFLGFSAYYQQSNYEAGIENFSGQVTTGGVAATPTAPATQPFSEQEYRGFNVVLNTGFDMKLTILNLFLHANYAVATRAPGAILGMRIQI
jgi:hypothetical protein